MNSKLTPDFIAGEIFDQYDTDKNGFLEYKEIKFMLQDTYKGYKHTVKEEEILHFLKSYDLNGDGKVSRQEYIKVINRAIRA